MKKNAFNIKFPKRKKYFIIIKPFNNFNHLISIYLIFLVFFQNIKKTISSRIIVKANSATASKNIINRDILPYLSAIYINGEKQSTTTSFTPGKKSINEYIFEFPSLFNNCDSMFFNCKSITYVDLSEFDASSCQSMSHMFYICKELKSINFGQIDTSQVTDMGSMFEQAGLIYINLSSFDTSKVVNMASMFSTMNNLLSLDLSSFDTSNVIEMGSMFKQSSKIISLNLSNFDALNVKNSQNIFTGVSTASIKFCFNGEKNTELYNKMKEMMGTSVYNNCNDACFKNPSNKFIYNSFTCVTNCYDTENTKYEYNNQCYSSCDFSEISAMLSPTVPYLCIDKIECDEGYLNYERTECIDEIPEGYYCNDENKKTIDKCDNKCKTCDNKDLCKQCNINYYPLENDPMNNNGFIECYNATPFRTYLDINDNIFKTCYESCLSCSQAGNKNNHNCLECNPGLRNDYLPNCYENCSEYHYFDDNNDYQCESSCPDGYKIIKELKKCTKDCRNESPYINEFNNECLLECPSGYHAPNDDKKCVLKLQCDNYYNYDYDDCWDIIPDGYFCNDTLAKTTDKCNTKCKTCNLESFSQNLCLECNNLEGYYEIENNELNINGYVGCLNFLPEKYFFDNENKKYKKCYETCKHCDELGDIYNHKCLNCYSNYTLFDTNCYEICKYYYYFDDNKLYHCTIDEQCPLDKNKLIIDKNECTDICKNEYNYELNNKCYKFCPEGSYYNYEHTNCLEYIPDGYYLNNTQTIDKCDEKCEKCNKNSTEYGLCIKCNNSLKYYAKENDYLVEGYYDCFNGEQDGFYLDILNNEYKKCYKTCKSCNEKGIIEEQKCTKCYSNYTLNDTNCYEICKYYYYFDDNKEYHCTIDRQCPDIRNKLIEEKNECIKECNNEYKFEYGNKCYSICPPNTFVSYNQTRCVDSIPEGYYLNDSLKRTIDKCDIKCENECKLNFEISNILCKSCNNDYNYFKKVDIEEKDGYYDCFKGRLEKYFFDNSTKEYKKCYKTCKHCDELGDAYNHKCLNCYSNYILNDTNCYEICKYYHYFDYNKEFHCTIEEKCPSEYPNLIIEKNLCVKNCTEDDDIFKYYYNKRCYETCPNKTKISKYSNYVCEDLLICNKYYNYVHEACLEEIPDGFYLNDSIGKTIDKCDKKCSTCNQESVGMNLCLSCNNLKNYYKIKEENITKNSYINCYNNSLLLEGYYLDKDNNYFDKCFEKCKNCNEKGIETNHKCTQCNHGFTLNGTNCYEICKYYYYFDSNNVYHCTENEECPNKYYLIPEKNQCITNCKYDDIYIYEHKGICLSEPYIPNCTNNSEPYIPNCTNNSMFIMTDTGGCINECDGNYYLNNICKLRFKNQTNQEYVISMLRNFIKNGSIDDIISDLLNYDKLGNINNKKYINLDDGISFHLKSSTNNLINNKEISSIDLGDCEYKLKQNYNIGPNVSLIILTIDYYIDNFLIPIVGYDVYNPITKEKLDLTICKNNLIKIEYPVLIDESSIYKYNPNSDYYTNDCLLKCSSTLFSKNGIKKNIAFYIHLFLFILFIFNSIQFYRKGYTKLIEHIKNILIQKEPKKETGNEPKVINNDDVFPAKARNNQSILKLKTPKNFRHSFRDGIAQDDIDYSDNYSNNQKSISKLKMLKIKYLQRSKQRSIHNYKPKPHELETDIDSSLSMNEYILNTYNYNQALGVDIRPFIKIYISFIKYKHPFLFLFPSYEDYNSIFVKINLIIISISLYFFVNVLFITKTHIHEIYIKGNMNNINLFIPEIFGSFIICYIIDKILKYFSMSDSNIYDIKKEILFNNMKIKAKQVEKLLKIKYILFFSLIFIFLLFIWFYLSLFGAVYQNTEIILFKNMLISYSISLLFPFISTILPCQLRRYSLKESKRECIFNTSRFLQFI